MVAETRFFGHYFRISFGGFEHRGQQGGPNFSSTTML